MHTGIRHNLLKQGCNLKENKTLELMGNEEGSLAQEVKCIQTEQDTDQVTDQAKLLTKAYRQEVSTRSCLLYFTDS